jgi:phosphoserine phosphatase
MHENNFINFDGTTFYSDSINDLPLLCAVEKAVGVNPDSKLRHECISRGWEIIDLP